MGWHPPFSARMAIRESQSRNLPFQRSNRRHGLDDNAREKSWNKQLDEAVRRRSAKDLLRLLDTNTIRPRMFELHMQSALKEAIKKRQGSLPLVRILLDKSANFFDGDTPLHLAAECGNLKVAAFFLEEQGIDPDTLDNKSETPLFRAAENDHVHMVELLLKHGANPRLTDSSGRTVLHRTAFKGKHEVLKFLLKHKEKLGIDINAVDEVGETAFFWAARGDHADIAKTLLLHGINPRLPNAGLAMPLHIAAVNGSLKVVAFLFENREKLDLDIDARDEDGETAFFWAAEGGQTVTAETLVEYGANPRLATFKGVTPLHSAAFENNLKAMRFLLENGERLEIGIDAQTNSGETALDWAAKKGHLKAVELLWKAGVRTSTEKKSLLALIQVQRKHKDLEGALQCVDKLIALHPKVEHVQIKADILIEANRASEAETVLLQHREHLENYKETLGAYSSADKLTPNHRGIIHKLGRTYELLKDLDKAKDWFETGLRLYPLDASFLYSFGKHHRYVSGDEAFIRLNKAADMVNKYPAPGKIYLYDALGKAYGDIGDSSTAARHYEMAAKLKNRETTRHPIGSNRIAPHVRELKTRLRP